MIEYTKKQIQDMVLDHVTEILTDYLGEGEFEIMRSFDDELTISFPDTGGCSKCKGCSLCIKENRDIANYIIDKRFNHDAYGKWYISCVTRHYIQIQSEEV